MALNQINWNKSYHHYCKKYHFIYFYQTKYLGCSSLSFNSTIVFLRNSFAFYPVWGQLTRIINFSLQEETDFLNKLNRKSGNKSKNNKLLNLIYLSTGRIKILSKSSITYWLQLPNLNYIYKDGTKSNIKYSNFGKNRISHQISTKIFCTYNRRYLRYSFNPFKNMPNINLIQKISYIYWWTSEKIFKKYNQ